MDTRILRIPWRHVNSHARSKMFEVRGSVYSLLDINEGYDSGWLPPVDRIVGCVSGSIGLARGHEDDRHELERGNSWISLGTPTTLRIRVTARRALIWICEEDELLDAIAAELGGTYEDGNLKMTIEVPKKH